MLSKLAVKRLTTLANFMDSIPRKKWKFFDMEHTTFDGCGTAACAAGWAELVPSFKRAGYTYHTSARFFDIKEFGRGSEWSQLFFSGDAFACRTPKQWAKHCRKFIRDNS